VITALEDAYYISGVVTAVAAVVGLVGLMWYAFETRRLRIIGGHQAESAAAQLERSIIPCVLFVEDSGRLDGSTEQFLFLKNVGAGPTLNIKYRLNSWGDWATCPPLSSGGSIKPGIKPGELRAAGGAYAEFTSLGGHQYHSRSEYVTLPPANAVLLEHSFEDG
jgi:hypothetical protein